MNSLALYFMARSAARDLVRSDVPLNEGIAKHASEHGLSQLQIQRVVEAANHEANALLQKTAEDKTFSFDLASLDGVLSALTPGTAATTVSLGKLAEAADALLEPRTRFDERVEALPRESEDAKIARFRSTMHALDKVADLAATQMRVVQMDRMRQMEKCASGFERLVTQAGEYIRRGGALEDMRKYAQAVEPGFDRGWDKIFGRVQEELQKLGHPFTGELASATELMADRKDRPGGPLPHAGTLKVTNGRHALAGELSTLRDNVSFLDRLADRTREIDNFNRAVRVSQRMIIDNQDVDTLFAKEAEKLAAFTGEELGEHIEKLARKDSNISTVEKGLVGTAVDHTGKASIKAVMKRALSDHIPGAFVGPGTPAAYRSK